MARQINSLLFVSLAVLLHAADSTLVATLIPSIVSELGALHLVSWSLSLYEVGSIVAASASGLLTRRLGLSRTMVLAASVFAGGCVFSALAPGMWWLLAGRALQGLGGGGMVAVSFIAVSVLFSPRLMPRVLGIVSMVWGMSAFLGPLIGGGFDIAIGWRYAFGLFAVAAIGLIVWMRFIQIDQPTSDTTKDNKPDIARFPLWRLILLTAGVMLIATAGIYSELITSVLLITGGLVALAYFVHLDMKKSDGSRMLPRDMSDGLGPIGGGLLMLLCFGMSTIAITVYGPLLITRLYGLSTLSAGYIVACASIGWSIAAIVFSGTPERLDRRMIGAGMCTLIVSTLGFLWVVPHGPVSMIPVFALLEGAGFGMAWAFILRRATAMAQREDLERIASSIATVHRLGYALGAAVVGVVANSAGLGANHADGTMDAITNEELRNIATWIFATGLPIAAIGLVGMRAFLKNR